MAVLIAVLGMHRSGTSAIAGMLSEHGVEFGPVSEQNRFNPRGNREIRELNRLHDRILERSGGSWSEPPAKEEIEPEDISERDRILAGIPGNLRGVKDPRMLILPEFWQDLDTSPIGVIRNPVAVCDSLLRRAANRPRRHPQLEPVAWERLWRQYNEALLAQLDEHQFPLIDFERRDRLEPQVHQALTRYRVEPTGPSHFFDESFLGHADEDWRSKVLEPETTDLWDRLEEHRLAV